MLVALDNNTAIAYVNRQGGRHSRELYHIAEALFRVCVRNRIQIRARHIQGTINLVLDITQHTRPDLSRRVDRGQSSPPDGLRSLEDTFGRRLGIVTQPSTAYVLLTRNAAITVDGMSPLWDRRYLYVFPPSGSITKVSAKTQATSHLAIILIAPEWHKSTG